VTLEAPHLDPAFLNSQSLAYRVVPVYSRLMRYKTGDDVAFGEVIIEPDLAERWEIARDGKTYTFHLRKGVKWHNLPPVNGRELTAEDVLFSYTRLWKTETSAQSPWFIAVQNIEATDKYTIKVTMKDPSATFFTLMAHAWAFIHPREVVERDGDVKLMTIGSGPFIMSKRQRDVKTELRRNPNYFIADIPYLDGVDVFFIPDDTAALAALRATQIDWLGLERSIEIKSIRETRPDMVMAQRYLGLSHNFHFATDVPPFNDDKLRKAVSLTLDRDRDIKIFLGGEGEYATIPSGNWKGWTLSTEELGEHNYWKRNLQRARKLLEEGGYPIPYEVPFLHNLLFDARVAGYVSDLNESGLFKLKVRPVTREEYLSGAFIGRYSAGYNFTMGGLGLALEPGLMLTEKYHPKQPVRNNSRVNDPILTKMIEEQDTIMDVEARKKKIHEIQRYAATKMYYAPLTQGFAYLYRQPYVRNLTETAQFNMGDVWRSVWLKK